MNILIFSHQRAGSSNLARFISHACGYRLRMETLNGKSLKNTNKVDWKNISYNEFSMLVKKYTGENASVVKHIYGTYPFIYDEAVLDNAISSKVIILHRNNYVAAAISSAIARTQKNWQTVDSPEDIGRISVNWLIEKVNNYKLAYEKLSSKFERLSDDVFVDLAYEDIYVSDEIKRRQFLETMLDDLGVSADNFEEAFSKYMSINKKTNSEAIYSQIENFDEIVEEFGNEWVSS